MNNQINMKKTNTKGVAALMTVIVIVSVIAVIGVIMAQMGINELLFGLQGDRSQRLLQVADSCAEEGYFRAKRDSGYNGGTIVLDDGSCTLTIAGSEPNRTLNIEASVDNLVRNFTVQLDVTTNINVNARGIDVTNWQEQ